MPAYTSRRYSWPGKKVPPRDLVDREKSGGESGGDSFSPDAGYERRVSYHVPGDSRRWTMGNGCDLVNVPKSCNKRDNCDNCSV